MRRNWTLIMLLAVGALVLAPESSASVGLGFKLGYTSGQLRAQESEGDFEVDKFALGGFCGGLLANVPLTSFLSLQPELMYFHKGGQYNVLVPISLPGVTIRVKESRSLGYIELPVLLKLSIAVSRPLRLTFVTGPSVGVNLSGNLKSTVDIQVPGMSFTLNDEQDIRKAVNDVELSYVIGGLFDWKLARGTVVVDQRFSFGLKPNTYLVVVEASKFSQLGFPMAEDMFYELKMYNYTFAVSIGYLF